MESFLKGGRSTSYQPQRPKYCLKRSVWVCKPLLSVLPQLGHSRISPDRPSTLQICGHCQTGPKRPCELDPQDRLRSMLDIKHFANRPDKKLSPQIHQGLKSKLQRQITHRTSSSESNSNWRTTIPNWFSRSNIPIPFQTSWTLFAPSTPKKGLFGRLGDL